MDQRTGARLRLGKIGFLNVLPIYYPLESGIVTHPFEIVSGHPARLNQLASEGLLEVSVVSSVEYARRPERYAILPDLSISCRGPVGSVFLLSRKPVHDLEGADVLVSGQSHSSIMLLKILFAYRYGISTRFTVADCIEAASSTAPPEAMLVIGDQALRLRGAAQYPHRLDLGKAWHDWTGLPFVFAVWVVRMNAMERWNGGITQAAAALATAKEWGRTHMETICARAAEANILDVPELRKYYHQLGYDLGEEERKGLERFFSCLVRIGEIDEAPDLRFCTAPAGPPRH